MASKYDKAQVVIGVASVILAAIGLALVGTGIVLVATGHLEIGVTVTNGGGSLVITRPGVSATSTTQGGGTVTTTETWTSTETTTTTSTTASVTTSVSTSTVTRLPQGVSVPVSFNDTLRMWVANVANFTRISVFIPSSATVTSGGNGVMFATSEGGPWFDAFGCTNYAPQSYFCEIGNAGEVLNIQVQGTFVGIPITASPTIVGYSA